MLAVPFRARILLHSPVNSFPLVRSMPSPRFALLCLYITTIMMGINGVFSKVIALDAVSITELRSAIAALALGVFILAIKRKSLRLPHVGQYKVVVGLGVLLALHWSSFFHAMQASTVAIGILAHYTYPVITVIAEPMFSRKLPALRDLLAGCAVLAGVALMVVPAWSTDTNVLTGVVFGLISAVTFGARNILHHRWLQDSSSSNVMFFQLLTVAVVTLPFLDWPAVTQLADKDWKLLLFLGVVSTATLHTLMAFTLRALSAKTVSLVSCLQPPTAIVLTWLMVDEVPSVSTVLGGIIILTTATYESINAAGKAKPIE